MNVNIEIVFLDFLKNDFLDVRGWWFGRQYSLIHPHLLYSLVAWGSTFPTYLAKLSSLQNKAVKHRRRNILW